MFIGGVFGLGHAANLQKPNTDLRDFLECAVRKESKPLILKSWLGGLDSNQDSQSQSLESYQLDDLPAVANKVVSALDGLVIVRFH